MFIIPDASIVVKWYVVEPLHEAANTVLELDDVVFAAPAFLKVEVCNAVLKKVQYGFLPKERGGHIINHCLQRSDIQFYAAEPYLKSAYQISETINHSLYDCLYIAVAQYVGGTVITTDQKFYQQCVSHESYKKHIKQLSDFA